jgi:hypothetical protein
MEPIVVLLAAGAALKLEASRIAQPTIRAMENVALSTNARLDPFWRFFTLFLRCSRFLSSSVLP